LTRHARSSDIGMCYRFYHFRFYQFGPDRSAIGPISFVPISHLRGSQGKTLKASKAQRGLSFRRIGYAVDLAKKSLQNRDWCQPAPPSSDIRLVVDRFPNICGPPEYQVNKEVKEEVSQLKQVPGSRQASRSRTTCRPWCPLLPRKLSARRSYITTQT